jgi:hypothetical protein
VTDGAVLLRSQRSLFDDAEAPVGLDEYQQFTTRTDRNDRKGTAGLGFVLLGLFGEIGSLLSALKKKQRDKDAFVAYHDTVIEELATRSGTSQTLLFVRVYRYPPSRIAHPQHSIGGTTMAFRRP